MSEKQQSETTDPAPPPQSQSLRRRRRTSFKMAPRPPVAVRALWESASPAVQQAAHERAMVLLEYWLGTKSKSEVAEELGVTPLRVWQMSRMALSGLVCGLLPQPRRRKGQRVHPIDPSQDVAALQKENARLQKENAVARQLIELLRSLPGNAGRGIKIKPAAGAKTRRKAAKESAPSRRAGSPGRRRSRGT